MRRRNKVAAFLRKMVEHDLRRQRGARVKPRHQGRDALNVIKAKTRRQRSVAADNQRPRFGASFAQRHSTPLQPIQMLRLAAGRLPDLRLARFPQPQAANTRDNTPVAIGKLQMRQRFAIAAALHRRSNPQFARTGRNQRHLRPLERQQQRTVAGIAACGRSKPRTCSALSSSAGCSPYSSADDVSASASTARPYTVSPTRHASRSPWNDGP